MDKTTLGSETPPVAEEPTMQKEIQLAFEALAQKLDNTSPEVVEMLHAGFWGEIINIAQGVTAQLQLINENERALIESLDHTKSPKPFVYETKEQFQNIMQERVANPALILNALKSLKKILACIDGGIVGSHHHKAGSGILLERTKLTLPLAEEYAPLVSIMMSLDLPTSMFAEKNNYAVLLPRGDLLDTWSKQRLKVVTSHHECGAAKLDMRRILESMLFDLYVQQRGKSLGMGRYTLINALVRAGESTERIKDVPTRSLIHLIVDYIMESLPASVIDTHAATYSETVAKVLHIKHEHIDISEMDRPEGEHIEEAIYIDFLCGILDGVAFDYRKLGLPQGFKFQPKVTTWTDTLDELKVPISIAFGETGMHKKKPFTQERPFQIVLLMSPQHPFLDEKIAQKEHDVRKLVREHFPEYSKLIQVSTHIPCLNDPTADRFERLLEVAVAHEHAKDAIREKVGSR